MEPAEFLGCHMRKCKMTSSAKHKNGHEILGRKIKREEPSVEQIDGWVLVVGKGGGGMCSHVKPL